MMCWRRRHCKRRARCDGGEPIAQLRVSRPPVKIGKPRFEPEGAGECELRHIEYAMHQRMIDLPLPQIDHSFTAICFVSDDGR
jgi:hypothetical protein